MKNGVPLFLKIQSGKIFYVRLCVKSSATKDHRETMTDAGALATFRPITDTHLRPISTNTGKNRNKNKGRKHKLRTQIKGYLTQTPPKEVSKA